MSTEDEWRELQSRGARNQFHFSNNEGYVGIQQYQHSFVNSSPTASMNNIPVGHSGDVLYHQPWQRNEYGNNEFTSLNFWQVSSTFFLGSTLLIGFPTWELVDFIPHIILSISWGYSLELFILFQANQNILDRDPSGASSSTAQQLIPSINSYPVTTSTKPTVSPCVASISRQQQQYQQMVELEPTTPALQAESAAVNMAAGDNHECPICGREFVYQLNFVKHLAAAACCQPPCKKSRKLEEENKETFKSSTLPRSSRSKKVTRSNSTKSRKTRHTIPSLNAVVPELIPSAGKEITCEYQENSLMTTGTKDLDIQQTTSTTRLLMATKTTTLEEIGEYCDFCQLQLGAAGNQQRHRLAHALVIQLTRCLEMSVMNSSRETDSGNNPAVFNWLTDQVRVNFSDHSWLRQAVKEVEQVLDCSNMDVDIRQHHGIQQDDNQFQNSLVELLVTEDPPHQKNTCRILDPVPEGLHPLELSETCWTSITSNPPSVQPDPLCSSSPLTVWRTFNYISSLRCLIAYSIQ